VTGPLVLEFRAPTTPLSQNEAKGRHWGRVRRDLSPWKDATWAMARNAIVQGRWYPAVAPPQHVPITVQVTIPFRTNRGRDAHNYTGTVVKAVVDGLVKAHIVPDDTPDWVTVLDSTLVVVGPLPAVAVVTVTITERSPT
jgi:hypothetical protein